MLPRPDANPVLVQVRDFVGLGGIVAPPVGRWAREGSTIPPGRGARAAPPLPRDWSLAPADHAAFSGRSTNTASVTVVGAAPSDQRGDVLTNTAYPGDPFDGTPDPRLSAVSLARLGTRGHTYAVDLAATGAQVRDNSGAGWSGLHARHGSGTMARPLRIEAQGGAMERTPGAGVTVRDPATAVTPVFRTSARSQAHGSGTGVGTWTSPPRSIGPPPSAPAPGDRSVFRTSSPSRAHGSETGVGRWTLQPRWAGLWPGGRR